ncbi:hypothetical protein V7S43_007612 [Phytophthora oleae]|uniref:Uncharacterized protein n=1 Tax=Phytophthora oleae TaxID=2107226 RepID=A0ABD3FLP7_9STRA
MISSWEPAITVHQRIFRNVLYAVEEQQHDGVFAAADGTYKLHVVFLSGNWVLVAFGTYRSQYFPAQKYCKSFVSWAYMFVRTEHEYAYTKLFKFVVKRAL